VAFWPEFTPEQEQEHRDTQAKNRPPSENEIFKQIEMAKIQSRQQEKSAEFQLKMVELRIRAEEILRKTSIDEAELEHKIGIDAVDKQLAAARFQLDQLTTMASTKVGDE